MSDGIEQFEHERRFLVRDRSFYIGSGWELITQAYVFALDGFAIRVRLTQKALVSGQQDTGVAHLTGKGPRFGAVREEYDTEVSPLWAKQVIQRSANVITKRRHHVVSDQVWEVDEFDGDNAGLVVAELEGGQEIRSVTRPSWALREIVNEPELDNDALASFPIARWSPDQRRAIGLT